MNVVGGGDGSGSGGGDGPGGGGDGSGDAPTLVDLSHLALPHEHLPRGLAPFYAASGPASLPAALRAFEAGVEDAQVLAGRADAAGAVALAREARYTRDAAALRATLDATRLWLERHGLLLEAGVDPLAEHIVPDYMRPADLLALVEADAPEEARADAEWGLLVSELHMAEVARPLADAVLAAVGDPSARAAAVLLLGRLAPADLASHAVALVAHVADAAAAHDVLPLLAPLDTLTPPLADTLLHTLRAAPRAVQRMALLTPVPLDAARLRTLTPDVPLPVPTLAPLGVAFDVAAEALAVLGADVVQLALLPALPLRARRSLACASRALRALVTPHLRAAELAVEDADWEDAAFVARLPGLRVLRVNGAAHDLPALRARAEVDVGTLAGSALLLGAALGGDARWVRLSLARADGTPQVVEAGALRTARRPTLYALLDAPDVAFLHGVLARNPHVSPEAGLRLLRSQMWTRATLGANPAMQAAFLQALHDVQGL